ncbi:MAG: 1,4-alpha-glucan branching protein GlgB [Candidatus Binatia bacterium]
MKARHAPTPLEVPSADHRRLVAGEHAQPHAILGRHPAVLDNQRGAIVRGYHPDASAAEWVPEKGSAVATQALGGGLFAAFVADLDHPVDYRWRFHFRDGSTWERRDPYRFLPTLGDIDLHLFNEGNHRRLWERLGARVIDVDGVPGVAFAVWAPSARRVSVVGEFCRWDGRLLPMRSLGASGVFELFVPDLRPGDFYKYEILTREGAIRVKTDPFAKAMERPPGTASRIVGPSTYAWGDDEWMRARATRDAGREPMYIYEMHLGSWMRVPEEGNRSLTYREIAPKLVEHLGRLGFSHVELLPIAEHPFEGSWGYQVSGYYAPTSRFGEPDDFRFFVDTCHRAGIGVILDWVPAHFPKDDFALRRFDGSALYEHEDPRLGEHPDWGTLIFNYGRNEVRNFLIANALYWLREFHIDGLRVDAVASMLYLDYSRKAGEWIPNRYGGRENLDAIEFFRATNGIIHEEVPGAVTIAEESTDWPGVTRPSWAGGLGFDFKWNMGWMHDTLAYMSREGIHRRWHHDQLTFAMLYEYSERFVMPLSHDEVVHLKKSLLEKMPGDLWQKFANLRLLFAYELTRPGKKLLFMGSELAPYKEWSHERSLDWHLAETPERQGLLRFLGQLGRIYREHPCFWRDDHDPSGFSWIDCSDRDQSVISYVRRSGDDHAVTVLNLTPVPREDYRIGAPEGGSYRIALASDDSRFHGSGSVGEGRIDPEPSAQHGYSHSFRLRLPPLGALILLPDRG